MALTDKQLAKAKALQKANPGIGRRALMKALGCTDWTASSFLRGSYTTNAKPTVTDADIADSLRVANKETASQLRSARLALGDIGEAVRLVKASVVAEPPVTFPKSASKRPAHSRRPVTLVIQLTDWHIGLVTPKGMIEGFNEFSWAVAQGRVAKLAKSIRKYTDVLRAGYTVDECVVLCTGDYVSGDIHDGLVRSNEFQAPVQAVKAGRLLTAFLQDMASLFPVVRVDFIAPGNHDRLSKKPQAQLGGENSWGYVVGSLAEALLEKQPNLEFNLYPSMQEIVEVAGRRYLIGHGDGILGTWGIPFYGIERKVSRESKARMNMPEHRHFHKIVIGHFHTGLDHPDWFVGGSLSGTDENDHKQGRHMPAHQTSWVVHPEHGEFGFTRWFLD